MRIGRNSGIALLICWFTLAAPGLSAQGTRQLSVKDIYGPDFRAERMEALRSLSNGQEYTVLRREGRNSRIDRFAYEGMKPLGTILSSSEEDVPNFTTYAFSKDERQILLGSAIRPIYRRSTEGTYHVYDRESKKIVRVSEDVIQSPQLSPDGEKVAYVYRNNLFVFFVKTGRTEQITTDGQDRQVINGRTDWVYEEEFSFVRAFEWNSSSDRIAFLRFDESEVPEFSMDVYGKSLYPFPYKFKYPKAGEANSVVSLHLYHLGSGTLSTIELEQSYYIPRIQWMNHPQHLSVQTLNRLQNDLRLYKVDAASGEVSELLRETDPAYVDVHDNLTFLKGDRFFWTSEKDGWMHIYLHDEAGREIRQVTQGPWEVTAYYGYDPGTDRIFYQSSERGSIHRDVYSIKIQGRGKLRLSPERGTNRASFSSNFKYFINTFQSATTPPRYTLHEARKGNLIHVIIDNQELQDRMKEYDWTPKEFSTLRVNGEDLNMYVIKPSDFDPRKEYPLLMFQYSGPNSQSVADTWANTRDLWHHMLASKGYLIACVDGRGTGLKGRDFRKVTYLNLLKYETEDQIEAARILSDLPYVDARRTGIWGWSYGGMMSTNCLFKGADVFELAISVAPVTSWRFYDTIYTERFMSTPQENAEGYDDNSPLEYPEKLEGKFLLIHGTGDDNVHVQNSMRLVEALVQAGKDFDWLMYPDRSHSISGGNTRVHLYEKMTDYIQKNL